MHKFFQSTLIPTIRRWLLVATQDVTEIVRDHKQVAESEQRLQDVLNTIHRQPDL